MDIANITSCFLRFCFFVLLLFVSFSSFFFVCLKTEGSFSCQACFLNIVKITSSTKNYHENLTFVAFDYITPHVCSGSTGRRAARDIFHNAVKIFITYQKGRSKEIMSYRRCSKNTIKKQRGRRQASVISFNSLQSFHCVWQSAATEVTGE